MRIFEQSSRALATSNPQNCDNMESRYQKVINMATDLITNHIDGKTNLNKRQTNQVTKLLTNIDIAINFYKIEQSSDHKSLQSDILETLAKIKNKEENQTFHPE